jgi:putative SOS response-associated peptidase YedK
LIGRITDRMPAILRQDDWPVWLGERDAATAAVKGLLRTFDDEGAWEMSEQATSKAAKAAKTNPQGDLF